jgi:hypothetical protein
MKINRGLRGRSEGASKTARRFNPLNADAPGRNACGHTRLLAQFSKTTPNSTQKPRLGVNPALNDDHDALSILAIVDSQALPTLANARKRNTRHDQVLQQVRTKNMSVRFRQTLEIIVGL